VLYSNLLSNSEHTEEATKMGSSASNYPGPRGLLANQIELADRYLSKGKSKARISNDDQRRSIQVPMGVDMPMSRGPIRSTVVEVPLPQYSDQASISSVRSSPNKSPTISRPASPRKGQMSPVLRKKAEIFEEGLSTIHGKSHSVDEIASLTNGSTRSSISSSRSAGDLIKHFELNENVEGRLSPAPVLGLKDFMKRRIRPKVKDREKDGKGIAAVPENEPGIPGRAPPAPSSVTEQKPASVASSESEVVSDFSGSTAADHRVCLVWFF
jgi:hypothetical protein